VDEILLALQSTDVPIASARTGRSVTKPRARLSEALSRIGEASTGPPPISHSEQMPAGGVTSSSPVNDLAATASLAIIYNGKLRDRVGQGNTALAPHSELDGTLTVTLSASGGRTVTALRLDSDAPGTWTRTTLKLGFGSWA
jgi:hypothetical protein